MPVSPSADCPVTVVVAAYNVGPYIDECLESLVAQTLPGLDILVIDDGSTDDTPRRVRRFVERFPAMIRVITQDNRGIGRVRNQGIVAARGKYLGYVDGDDWVEPEMYETLYRGAEQYQADQTICDGALVDHTTRHREPFYDRELWDRLQPGDGRLFDPAQLPDFFLLNASVCKRLYRVEFLRRVRYQFVERLLFEDVPAHYELFCETHRVLLIDRPFYLYRQGHPHRRTGRSDRMLIQAVEVVFRMVRAVRRLGAEADLWANLIREQDWLLRWLGRQISPPHALEFARAACRLARYFPVAGQERFREKFRLDLATRMGVALQIAGDAEAYMEYVRSQAPQDGRVFATSARGKPVRRDLAPEPASDCRVPILLYHSVADDGPDELAPYRVSPAAFREQMLRLLERGYYAVSLEDWRRCLVAKRPLPGRPFVITFDDGYDNLVTNAWPVLAETGFRATIFAVTGRVGQVNDWDGEPGRRLRLMGWDELRFLQQHGNAIGSHCAFHRDLTKLSDNDITRDAIAAREAIRSELGRAATAVAFPWGIVNKRVRLVLAESGYCCGVGISAGLSTLDDDPMDLPRIEIFGDDDLDAFALKIDLVEDESSAAVSPPAAAPVPPAAPPFTASAAPLPAGRGVASIATVGTREKLSFVLPVALAGTGRPTDELARLKLLLASFCKYFDMASLADFLVVTRPDDLAVVAAAAGAFAIPSLAVVDERDLCPELDLDPDTTNHWPAPNRGWYRQQILKLAAVARVPTDFYMTLDSDIMFVRRFAPSDLVSGGKSLVNTQSAGDYDSLWLPDAARHEVNCRRDRDREAARVLRMDRRGARFYGETPVVLSAEIVRRLTQHLETTSGKNWQRYLLEQLPWTEYSLYFTFAEASGLFDRHHVAGGFDTVLGMRDSLWSPPESYADGRSLSSWQIGRQSSDTVAVVVQSYLAYPAEAVGARAAALSIL